MPLIYEELRKMARRYTNQQNPGHRLQTTALIHETYLRMVKQKEKHFQNRAHFLASPRKQCVKSWLHRALNPASEV